MDNSVATQLVLHTDPNGSSDVIPATQHEEWSTTKKIVTRKNRQTETKVQRQIVMEDGRVIADSGPQVSSRTKEDEEKQEEESSSGRNPTQSLPPPVLPSGHIRVPGSQSILHEVTSRKSTTKSNKVQNSQYHDEGLKELTGFEIHKKAICSPNDLISLSNAVSHDSAPRGRLVHYSTNGRTLTDAEETREITKKDVATGESVTEVIKTFHNEEKIDDELPQNQIHLPLEEEFRESHRSSSYYQNYDDEDEDDVQLKLDFKARALAHVQRLHVPYDPEPPVYKYTRPALRSIHSSSSSSSEADRNEKQIYLPEPDYDTEGPVRTFYFGDRK